MSLFTKIRVAKRAADEHKKAVTLVSSPQSQESKPYRHVPTHAASDSINIGVVTTAPAFREQIREQHRRRSELGPNRTGSDLYLDSRSKGVRHSAGDLSITSVLQQPRNPRQRGYQRHSSFHPPSRKIYSHNGSRSSFPNAKSPLSNPINEEDEYEGGSSSGSSEQSTQCSESNYGLISSKMDLKTVLAEDLVKGREQSKDHRSELPIKASSHLTSERQLSDTEEKEQTDCQNTQLTSILEMSHSHLALNIEPIEGNWFPDNAFTSIIGDAGSSPRSVQPDSPAHIDIKESPTNPPLLESGAISFYSRGSLGSHGDAPSFSHQTELGMSSRNLTDERLTIAMSQPDIQGREELAEEASSLLTPQAVGLDKINELPAEQQEPFWDGQESQHHAEHSSYEKYRQSPRQGETQIAGNYHPRETQTASLTPPPIPLASKPKVSLGISHRNLDSVAASTVRNVAHYHDISRINNQKVEGRPYEAYIHAANPFVQGPDENQRCSTSPAMDHLAHQTHRAATLTTGYPYHHDTSGAPGLQMGYSYHHRYPVLSHSSPVEHTPQHVSPLPMGYPQPQPSVTNIQRNYFGHGKHPQYAESTPSLQLNSFTVSRQKLVNPPLPLEHNAMLAHNEALFTVAEDPLVQQPKSARTPSLVSSLSSAKGSVTREKGLKKKGSFLNLLRGKKYRTSAVPAF